MLKLFRYITGYITVCFSGENCEEILNLCAKHSVKLWNLRLNKGKIIGNIRAKDFYLLRKIRKRRTVKIHIINKKGITFKTARYNRRFGFIAGVALFFVILQFLSSFIWNIDVVGNNYIEDNEILAICREIGINEGTKIKEIDTLKSAQSMLIKHKKLAWASLNIEGCKLTVNVTEIKRANEDDYQNVPSNLIAAFDGEIKKIDVTSGNVLIKIGDTVHKGDLLVSGVIENQSSTLFVDSKGSVTAATKRIFTVSENFNQTKNIKTGDIKKRSVIEFFSIRIPLYLGKESKDYISREETLDVKLFGEKLPINKYSKYMQITEPKKVIYTEEELLEILKNKLQNNINKSGLDIIEEGEMRVDLSSGGITLSKQIITREDIAQKQPILINSIN
ncbi:MAG: sporulation protein YqfD [Clostridia bacterium]|nr:sporulation protein YqfD [Clostridia bacterium]